MSSYVEYKRNKAKTENAKRIKMQKSLEKRMHILEKGMRRGPQNETPAHRFSCG